MDQEITLCIKADGSMYIKQGEKPETDQQEQTEGGRQMPVKSIDEALQAIKQLAEAIVPPSSEQITAQNDEQQQSGMMEGFQR